VIAETEAKANPTVQRDNPRRRPPDLSFSLWMDR
jgi:hypothetical protein